MNTQANHFGASLDKLADSMGFGKPAERVTEAEIARIVTRASRASHGPATRANESPLFYKSLTDTDCVAVFHAAPSDARYGGNYAMPANDAAEAFHVRSSVSSGRFLIGRYASLDAAIAEASR